MPIINRKTNETNISLELNLYGQGKSAITTGIGFFDHILTLFAFHGLFDINLTCQGDLEVDDHHSIEDIGIALGQAFRQSLPENKNFVRYGSCILPMDETLANAVVDISGRPFLVFQADFTREMVGNLSTEMIEEFFRAFAMNAGITLHLKIEYGKNDHHKIEALFKATARALRIALEPDPKLDSVSSTKGVI
jgi:imidazoleglycerol-phosphate dehydratase